MKRSCINCPCYFNSTGIEHLGINEDELYRQALQVMSRIVPSRPGARIVPSSHALISASILTEAHAQNLVHITSIQDALEEAHKNVTDKFNSRSRKAIAAHYKATRIVEPSFEIGDTVLV